MRELLHGRYVAEREGLPTLWMPDIIDIGAKVQGITVEERMNYWDTI